MPSLLVVGCYTRSQPHVKQAHGKGLSLFLIEESSNVDDGASSIKLKCVAENIDAGTNPSFLAATSDGKFIFAANADIHDDGKITVLKRSNIATSRFSYKEIDCVSSAGCGPCYLSLNNLNRFLVASNYHSSTASIFKVCNSSPTISNEDRIVLSQDNVFYFEGASMAVPERQERPHPHCFAFDPQNPFAYIADLGTDQLIQYHCDPKCGVRPESVRFYTLPSGSGPRHVCFHPGGRFLYLVTELSNQIFVFSVPEPVPDTHNTATAELRLLQTTSTLEPEPKVTRKQFKESHYAADVQITPSGRFLYVSNRVFIEPPERDRDDNIAMFRVNTNGGLTLLGHQSVYGKVPRNILIEPTGKYLFVANQNSDSIFTFKIKDSGLLELCGKPVGCATPAGLFWIDLNESHSDDVVDACNGTTIANDYSKECQASEATKNIVDEDADQFQFADELSSDSSDSQQSQQLRC